MGRSLKKGPYVVERLLEKVMKADASGSREPIKTWARACTIVPEFVGKHFAIHDGRKFVKLYVTEDMVEHRLGEFAPKIAEQLEIDAKYDVYLSRQAADIAAYRRDEGLVLPEELDYSVLPGLSNEAKQRLQAVRPRTIGQAGRIDGMTPAALMLLVTHVKRQSRAAKIVHAKG